MSKTPPRLGKYEILEEIGRGGFAVVYKARDPNLDRIVALKVLHATHTGHPEVVERFLAEARQAAKLRHNGIVRVLDVGEHQGQPYIAMEHFAGGSLGDRLTGEPLSLETAVVILERLASALDYAHKRGLVHRDVKPANVLFDEEGHAVLADFGLVKSLAASGMTTDGTRLGTPAYMAPEQSELDADVSPATDIYALGVVAYEILTGRVPFQAESLLAVLHAHMRTPPPDPRSLNESLDEDVARAVLHALAKSPADRPQSARAFAESLRAILDRAEAASQRAATLEALYPQAEAAVAAEQWEQAIALCGQILQIDPGYRQVGALLAQANAGWAEKQARLELERRLGGTYQEGKRFLTEGEWAEAIRCLQEVVNEAPDYQDAAVLLEQANQETRKQAWYETATQSLKETRFDQACRDLVQLLRADPAYRDAGELLVSAVEGLLDQIAGLSKTLTGKEKQLKQIKEAYRQLEHRVGQIDALLLAVADGDRAQALKLAESLAQVDLPGVQALLPRLRVEEKPPRPAQPETDAALGDRRVWERDGKEMVRVPAGAFLYGDDKQKVKLPEFWIDKTPVTNAEYARFVAATGQEPPQHWKGKTPPKEIADHPVTYVSWHDAVAYAEWAGKRLPTEQEWEKAARGTDGWVYPWGDQEPTPELCNFDWKEGGTTPVAKYSPQGDSPYGCVDMAGNVWEWTSSDYDANTKVLRGGGWYYSQADIRTANRLVTSPGKRNDDVGFRCVVEPGG